MFMFITVFIGINIVNGFVGFGHFYKPNIIKIQPLLGEPSGTNNAVNNAGGGYPFSKQYYEESLKRLNSYNKTIRETEILSGNDNDNDITWTSKEESLIIIHRKTPHSINNNNTLANSEIQTKTEQEKSEERLNRRKYALQKLMNEANDELKKNKKEDRSEHFEVIYNSTISFKDVGGFNLIKNEMMQCVDILKNWDYYSRFNVRTPKGMILEGPPGNGKTMLARSFAGESNVAFIPVSGSEFQDKYIGVGSSKVRELFQLAIKNIPCVIFIDEIDALGRRRSNEGGDITGAERDNTLNELLVAMDGFKNNSGIFIIGATNRADLLDPALMRPGRIDKKIYVGMPDINTRMEIIKIHIRGKPHNLGENYMDDLILMTNGFSGAQIENLLNEAMLHALRNKREEFNKHDLQQVSNRVLGGWQSVPHNISDEMLERICCHEMGHAIMGLLCSHYPLMQKIVINLNSPNTPGMTIFEEATDNILNTRESLFEYLAILFGGRIAEEIIYGVGSVSNGAVGDYKEAYNIARKMIIDYGMGDSIYSGIGEDSKNKIDIQIEMLLNDAYAFASSILYKRRDWIVSGSNILKKDLILTRTQLKSYLML